MKNCLHVLLPVAFFFVAGTSALRAQDKQPEFGIKFSGFLRNDFYFDSRQSVFARDGELELYPKDILKDANGKDINANPELEMIAVATRLTGTVWGPDAFGAKTSGILEVEFLGISDAVTGAIRLRHAYARLDWPKTQLAFGQYWHPLFVTDCYPGTVAYGTGIPFQPFSRATQIRLTQKLANNLNLIVAAISQREPAFSSNGPNGGSAEYMRNGIVPNLHAQLQYKATNLVAGLAFDYKTIRPYLSITSGSPAVTTELKEAAQSTAIMAYAKYVGKSVTVKLEGLQGENMYDHVMIGGYMQYGSGASTTFKPTSLTSVWAEINGNGKKIIPGLFVGYCKNNGASDGNAVSYFGRGTPATGRGIDNIIRVAPRVEFVSGKFKFSIEPEWTQVAYGATDASKNGKVGSTTDKVSNVRLLFTTTYSF